MKNHSDDVSVATGIAVSVINTQDSPPTSLPNIRYITSHTTRHSIHHIAHYPTFDASHRILPDIRYITSIPGWPSGGVLFVFDCCCCWWWWWWCWCVNVCVCVCPRERSSKGDYSDFHTLQVFSLHKYHTMTKPSLSSVTHTHTHTHTQHCFIFLEQTTTEENRTNTHDVSINDLFPPTIISNR